MRSLKDLYKNHSGKVSDKWSIYLNEYEDKKTRELHGAINRKCAKKYFDISNHTQEMLDIFLNLDDQLK